MKYLPLALFVFFYSSFAHSAKSDTLYVDGPWLYSAAGERIVLRGFNEMFVWSNDKTGERLLAEIAQSGANSVRLVWDYNFPGEQLNALIENTIAQKMIAIPECHNATGKWNAELQACVDFWKQDTLKATIEKQRKWTILNIANEAGPHNISDEDFLQTYKKAITELREWGYTVPIMIDATRWGQDLSQLVRTAPALLQHDPLKNIIFSAHSYWDKELALKNYQLMATSAHEQGIVYIIGEGPSVTRVGQCDDPEPLPYLEGMKILQENNIGWLNWSWGGMRNGDCDDFLYFDITHRGEFGAWQHEPGAQIVALSPHSVMQTSERPASFYNGKDVAPSGIYLHIENTTLGVGERSTYTSLVAPLNAANQTIEIKILSGKDKIKIDKTRKQIKALKKGQALIRAQIANTELHWDAPLTIQ